jgi:hypothetical protein
MDHGYRTAVTGARWSANPAAYEQKQRVAENVAHLLEQPLECGREAAAFISTPFRLPWCIVAPGPVESCSFAAAFVSPFLLLHLGLIVAPDPVESGSFAAALQR